MPQHGAPQEGECTRQVAGSGTETGLRSLIRNRKPHRKTQDTIRDSRPVADMVVASARCNGYRRRSLGLPGVPSRIRGARSSAGEHYVDIVGVTGSIPVAPTTNADRQETMG